MELTSSFWCLLLRTPSEEDRIWQELCHRRYPTMAARISGDDSSSAPSSPATMPASPPKLPAEAPALELSFVPPSRLECEPSQWRCIFQRRFLRQLAWDAQKRRTRKTEAAPGTRTAKEHSCRTRTCKRCGVSFDAKARGSDSICYWHSGRFVAMCEDGTEVSTGSQGKDFERRAQHIIKAHNRKKSSKKANVVVFGAACETGVAREDGVAWRWSCCFDESLVARGCSHGPHQ